MSRTVAEELRAVMADRGLTQHALADLAGFAPSSVSNWTTGATMPLPHALRRLEEVLETPRVTMAARRGTRCAHRDCDKAFVPARPWQRYCSRPCSQRASGERAGERRRDTARRDLLRIRADVQRMCRSCVGASDVCVQADCPLRRHCPFPLVSKAGRHA